MSNPLWYDELIGQLQEQFTLQEPPIRLVDGERFLREFLNDSPPDDMNDKDSFVEIHYEKLQEYLKSFDWVIVDTDSQVWMNKRLQSGSTPKPDGRVQRELKDVNESKIKLFNGLPEPTIENVEEVRHLILDDELIESNLLEEASYKVAKFADDSNKYTNIEKSELWEQAANRSVTKVKKLECYEKSADYLFTEHQYDASSKLIEKCIVLIEKRYDKKNMTFCEKVISRIKLFCCKANSQADELLRLSRKFRLTSEQAGLRDSASQAFAFECDTLMQRKSGTRFFSFIYWLCAKYGESPVRVLLSSLVLIAAFAGIYDLIGIRANISGASTNVENYWLNFYFSIVTFTTLGYGDYSPVGATRLIAAFQALTGLFMTSLFLVTFVRRYSR